MPTPAVHLALAEDILRRDDLRPAAARLLREERGPFLLGTTAPDVRTVSGQDREECHFYTVPRTSEQPAYRELFSRHPSLAHVDAMSASQVAFVAGYIAHLELDELWLDDVFTAFLLGDWASLRERLFLHNVLRTWLDHQAQEALNGAVSERLRLVEVSGLLPFVRDPDLRIWRDWLVRQLEAGKNMETAEVLAGRMGIPASRICAIVRSPAQMDERVFRHFPRSLLESFRRAGYERSVRLIDWYVGGSAHRTGKLRASLPSAPQSIDRTTLKEAS